MKRLPRLVSSTSNGGCQICTLRPRWRRSRRKAVRCRLRRRRRITTTTTVRSSQTSPKILASGISLIQTKPSAVLDRVEATITTAHLSLISWEHYQMCLKSMSKRQRMSSRVCRMRPRRLAIITTTTIDHFTTRWVIPTIITKTPTSLLRGENKITKKSSFLNYRRSSPFNMSSEKSK